MRSIWLRNNKTPEATVLSYMKDLFTIRREEFSKDMIRRNAKINWPRLYDSAPAVSLMLKFAFNYMYSIFNSSMDLYQSPLLHPFSAKEFLANCEDKNKLNCTNASP